MFAVRLKFNVLINKIVVKAVARSNSFTTCFLSLDPETLYQAFKTYVRPIVEYALGVFALLSYLKKSNRSNDASRRA